jgi:hypothetical protein
MCPRAIVCSPRDRCPARGARCASWGFWRAPQKFSEGAAAGSPGRSSGTRCSTGPVVGSHRGPPSIPQSCGRFQSGTERRTRRETFTRDRRPSGPDRSTIPADTDWHPSRRPKPWAVWWATRYTNKYRNVQRGTNPDQVSAAFSAMKTSRVQSAAEGWAEFQDRCISHSASPPQALLRLQATSVAPPRGGPWCHSGPHARQSRNSRRRAVPSPHFGGATGIIACS